MINLFLIKFSCYHLVVTGLQHSKTLRVLLQFWSSFCSFVKNFDHQNQALSLHIDDFITKSV